MSNTGSVKFGPEDDEPRQVAYILGTAMKSFVYVFVLRLVNRHRL